MKSYFYFDSLPFKSNKQNYIYAGIGSRKIPIHIATEMTNIASYLENIGYKLRSGHAIGSDLAFENGVKNEINKEIYLANSVKTNSIVLKIAREIHPNPKSLDLIPNSQYVWNLMARNTYQVFGIDLTIPVDLILCWTPDGIIHYKDRTRATGGTGQAIELASRKNIPVINMFNDNWKGQLEKLLNNECSKNGLW